MTSEKGYKKDKNQNIQVFVRLRPLNQRERDIKSLGVIEVLHNREVVVRQSQHAHTKKFTFDHAFGPNAKQVEVYQEVVSPLIEEVLAGYNCTVFAYGQTGTGKTHTMVGENSGDETTWQTDPLAGIIPRALSQLFDELRISNTEYTVRVSYLELYNEELFDLLSSSEDNSKLRIYEDVTRKGSNIVNGLEEITVYNKNEVYKIMAQGQERKRVASTLMNAQSSRSHTVFTIVVHMKENSPEGEELVKIGKLNLVDLAGSENISKAGSDNPAKKERARECVNINQSLLTLGRVITALVERHPHIPYRESKLTRILQESLGGRTKTSIIATISPGHKDLEETMSTLEYANRAKNIQNKPEINQKMTKKAILKEYAEEIDRLKRDLQAARDKNGVYLANETFTELTLKQEEQRKEIQELLLKKRAMEEEKDKMENVFSELNKALETRISELNATKNKLSNTKAQLINTHNLLRSSRVECSEQAHLVARRRATEAALAAQARALLDAADTAASHAHCLHDTVDKRRSVESANLSAAAAWRARAATTRAAHARRLAARTGDLVLQLHDLHDQLEDSTTTNVQALQDNKSKLEELVQKILETTNDVKSLTSESQTKLLEVTNSHRALVQSSVDTHHSGVQAALTALVQSVADCVQSVQSQDVPGAVGKFVDQWYCGAAQRVLSLQQLHAAYGARARGTERRRGEAARRARGERRAAAGARARDISTRIAEIEEEKARLQGLVARQAAAAEAERGAAEARLQRWAEAEARRVQEHVESEREALELRLAKQAEEMAADRAHLEALLARQLEAQRLQQQDSAEELERLEQDMQEAEAGGEESLASLTGYGKEFDEGTIAISTDMEVFTRNVVDVVHSIHSELLRTFQVAREQIEKDAETVTAEDSASSKKFIDDSDEALAQLVSANKDVMDTVLNNIEANTNTTVSALAALSSSTCALAAAAGAHGAAQAGAARALGAQVARLQDHLAEAGAAQEAAENKWLDEDYKVYSPTGKTPSRTEYRYPRALAATSPHERILARFRAMRRQHDEDDCIVVESDTESRQASDCDSSMSEDSATFAAPSPPAPPSPPALRPPLLNGSRPAGIVKCTSESDIFIKRHEDSGKENADRSMTYKKPSRLPAPALHSVKKPLLERNVN